MAGGWESEWSALDPRTRSRLRRAAIWGREVTDPDEAALVAAFARSKADDRRGLQLALHVLVIACLSVSLIINLHLGRTWLAAGQGVLVVGYLVAFVLFLGSRGRLLQAAERNERVASSGRR